MHLCGQKVPTVSKAWFSVFTRFMFHWATICHQVSKHVNIICSKLLKNPATVRGYSTLYKLYFAAFFSKPKREHFLWPSRDMCPDGKIIASVKSGLFWFSSPRRQKFRGAILKSILELRSSTHVCKQSYRCSKRRWLDSQWKTLRTWKSNLFGSQIWSNLIFKALCLQYQRSCGSEFLFHVYEDTTSLLYKHCTVYSSTKVLISIQGGNVSILPHGNWSRAFATKFEILQSSQTKIKRWTQRETPPLGHRTSFHHFENPDWKIYLENDSLQFNTS